MKTKTIAEIREMFQSNSLTESKITQLRHDSRKGVQAIVTSYERKKRELKALEVQFEKMSEVEQSYRKLGKEYIAGVDEAGRGPLAGPVVAAAVILPKQFKLLGLTDSKKLTKDQRNKYYKIIKREAISYHISIISHEEIDDINIYEATKKAMKDALLGLKLLPDQALIDAVPIGNLPFPTRSIIKGDETCIAISAASVLAKVTRDQIMKAIDKKYPVYDFKNNMGYGTKQHLDSLKEFGISPYHRKSFAPVRRFVNGGD